MPDRPSLLQRLDRTRIPMLAAHAILGVVFIEYGMAKVGHPIEFLKQVREYHLFPETPSYFINLTAVVLPWIEIVCGVLLLCGLFHRAAGTVVVVMLLVFTSAVFIRAVGVYQREDIGFCQIQFDCGCGAGVIVICKKLLINLGLIALSMVVLVSKARLAMPGAVRSCHAPGSADEAF